MTSEEMELIEAALGFSLHNSGNERFHAARIEVMRQRCPKEVQDEYKAALRALHAAKARLKEAEGRLPAPLCDELADEVRRGD